jgi:hypothetical protein
VTALIVAALLAPQLTPTSLKGPAADGLSSIDYRLPIQSSPVVPRSFLSPIPNPPSPSNASFVVPCSSFLSPIPNRPSAFNPSPLAPRSSFLSPIPNPLSPSNPSLLVPRSSFLSAIPYPPSPSNPSFLVPRSSFLPLDLTIPSGLGVNIHFIKPVESEVTKIARCGFRWVRMDMYWNEIESRPGRYDFQQYELLMDSLSRNGLRAMFILDHVNPLYGPEAPRDAGSVAAFARFAAAAASHFAGRGVIWEIWNEPNADFFWKPHANVAEYARLAAAATSAIRSAAPGEIIAGPAVLHFDWSFLDACFRSGAARGWDLLTIHPYRDAAPETVSADWKNLAEMQRMSGSTAAPASGEWGYSDYKMSSEQHAQYAVRSYLVNLMNGVALNIWYDWKDDVQRKEPPERHYGLVQSTLEPKPATVFLSTLVRELDGYHFVKRVESADFNYVLLFQLAEKRKFVAWTTSTQVPTAHVPLKEGRYRFVSLEGRSQTGAASKYGIRQALTASPVIFEEQ